MSASLGGGADLYAILGVDRHADEAAINASYRRLAKLKHPDKNRTNPQATAEFQDLNKAYSVLRDARLRRDYDQLHPLSGARARGRPATPPAAPGDVHPQSAARAAAATAAENAKTPAQRRAEADAALRANAARYFYSSGGGGGGGGGRSSGRHRRHHPLRSVRLPATWDNAGADALFNEDAATRALQDQINTLRRAMQQRDATEAALRRQQKQLAARMEDAWAVVTVRTAALRALDAERTALLGGHGAGGGGGGGGGADDWFQGLFGEAPPPPPPAPAPPGQQETMTAGGVSGGAPATAADAQRRLDALQAETDRLRADLDRVQSALAAARSQAHAVVAQLAASAAERQAQDEKLRVLAARYRTAAFASNDAAAAAATAAGPPNNGDEPFDGWVAWEAPEATQNLWEEHDEDEDEGDEDGGEDEDEDENDSDDDDGDGDGDAHSTDRQERQWIPFNAKAPEWVPSGPVGPAAAGGHSDSGTNVWDDGSSEERFNADLLHIGSDNEEGGREEDSKEGEEDEDEEDGNFGDFGDDDDDAATAWGLDEDLCEAYTERLKLDEDRWHAETCREW